MRRSEPVLREAKKSAISESIKTIWMYISLVAAAMVNNSSSDTILVLGSSL
jgi:hypothetical protein